MKQREWERLYRDSAQWRRMFGSGAPVCVAAADPESEQLYGLINRLASPEPEPTYVLLQGGTGTGKSMCIAAAEAALSEADIDHVVLDPREPDKVSRLFRSLGRSGEPPVVLVDDCDRFRATLSQLIQRRSSLAGLLITTTEVESGITQQLTGERDAYVRLPHIQYRVSTLLLMASLMWEELIDRDSDLSAACDDSAVATFLRGPLEEGAWSLNEVLKLLSAQLVSTGDLVEGQIRRRITGPDIASAILQHASTRFVPTPPKPRATQVVLEGETDVAYLQYAASIARTFRKWDLLDGLDLQAAAPGRGGGAEAVTGRLIGLRERGHPALGIYDNDLPGRRAAKLARERSLSCLLLPEGLDPLRRKGDRVVVEIEDLLPVSVLDRFYEEHAKVTPEERHWCNRYWRLVPAGSDKDTLTEWVAAVATFEDMGAFVYLLCVARAQLGLPVPADAPSLRDWEQSIRTRQVEDPTVGFPFRIQSAH